MPFPRPLLARALLLTVLGLLALPAGAAAQSAPASDLQAAFLINFARFTEWPAAQKDSPLRICVAGDERVAKSVAEAGRVQRVNGRAVELTRLGAGSAIETCHLLFVARDAGRTAAPMLQRARALPILTVSDAKDFAVGTGIIELMVDGGHMRFAVNAGAARRAGLTLSSRLLRLAQVVHGQTD